MRKLLTIFFAAPFIIYVIIAIIALIRHIIEYPIIGLISISIIAWIFGGLYYFLERK